MNLTSSFTLFKVNQFRSLTEKILSFHWPNFKHDSFVLVLLPPTNSLERRRRTPQSWQRVKAIKPLPRNSLARGEKIIYIVFSLHFFNYNLCSRTPSREKKTWELVVKHFRNCFSSFYVSVFQCSSILLKSKIAFLLFLCRLGTFSWEKSCLIIFRHKYECILAYEEGE